MITPQHLLKVANWTMPFGKYQGKVLIDLPEEYLLWLRDKGWPRGELGQLLELTLEIKIEGSEKVINPLRGQLK